MFPCVTFFNENLKTCSKFEKVVYYKRTRVMCILHGDSLYCTACDYMISLYKGKSSKYLFIEPNPNLPLEPWPWPASKLAGYRQ
jgi:UDP-2,3-diacylglucosamine pyrophosphatase LpxH